MKPAPNNRRCVVQMRKPKKASAMIFLIFLPFTVLILTAVVTVMILLIIELNERRRMARYRMQPQAKLFQPVLISQIPQTRTNGGHLAIARV